MRLDPITLINRSRCYARVERNQKSSAATAALLTRLYELVLLDPNPAGQKVMPDDHSEVVPLLPIPNRTVKRLCADDSADSRVKVGHRQAVIRGAPSTDGAFSSVLLPVGQQALMRTQKACYNVSLR